MHPLRRAIRSGLLLSFIATAGLGGCRKSGDRGLDLGSAGDDGDGGSDDLATSGDGDGNSDGGIMIPGFDAGAICTPAATSGGAFIRYNQVGYGNADAKPLLLLSPAAVSGSFTVEDGACNPVLTASIGADQGSWSTAFPHVYLLDVSSLITSGNYTITVKSGTLTAAEVFTVGPASALYAPLLANALFFYKAQEDGPDVDTTVIGRGPSHLADQSATVYGVPTYDGNDNLTSTLTAVGGGTVDVSGGWFDAGDFIKFVETASYVVAVMEVADRDYPAYTVAGGVANFYAEAKFGIGWLRKMWNDGTQTLYYQVGIGNGTSDGKILGDHDIWRLPEVDDTWAISAGQTTNPAYYVKFRPAFRFAAGGAMLPPNLAGRLAADFALCSQVYRAADAALADQCLLAAEHVFALANTSPGTPLFTTSPQDYYPEGPWHDDLELGAVELYNALAGLATPPPGLPQTSATFYLQQAATWAKSYLASDAGGDTLNLYDVSALAHYELYKAIGKAGSPSGLAVTQAQLLADLKAQVDKGVALAKSDPFRFAAGYGASTLGDAAPHALGLAVSARFYAELSGDATYRAFANQQRDYILGNNAWGTSFIVGAGKLFPHCLQHQVANLSGSSDGKLPLVLGAMPDGPGSATDIASGDKDGYAAPQNGLGANMAKCPADGIDTFKTYNGASGGAYQDDVRSWPTSEPADDYSALSIPFFLQLMN